MKSNFKIDSFKAKLGLKRIALLVLFLFLLGYLSQFKNKISLFNHGAIDADAVNKINEKLYRYVVNQQIKNHENSRYIGAWEVTTNFSEVLTCQETDSFFSVLTLLILNDISKFKHLPHQEEVEKLTEKSLAQYLGDTKRTHEPAGTIGFWPLALQLGKRGMRTIEHCRPYEQLNLPNDLDTSAVAAAWFINKGVQKDFVDSFIHTVGAYRDIARKPFAGAHPHAAPLNSGAFLVYPEPELTPISRISWGSNDVDCVVNLNILTAIGLYTHSNSGKVPEVTQQGVQSACNWVTSVLIHERTDSCAIYYERTSQFLIAYARAYQGGISCLKDSLEMARSLVVREARSVLEKSKQNPTENAEILVALKKLYAPQERKNGDLFAIQSALTKKILSQVLIEENSAHIESPDRLFIDGYTPGTVFWTSPSFSTVLALQALAID
jgi:hypothetical protein